MRYGLATIILGPLLAQQGHRVRKQAVVLPVPAGPRAGSLGRGPELRILVVGDSAGAGVGVSDQSETLAGRLVRTLAVDHTVHWQVSARSGATAAKTLQRLPRIASADWDWVIVSVGVNDAVARTPLAAWIKSLTGIHAFFAGEASPPRILFSGLPPMHLFPALPQPLRWYLGLRARELDRALATWTLRHENCVHLDTSFSRDPGLMASDGFHPGPELYRLWAGAVAAHVRSQSAQV